jgi:hypothetical protein
MQDLWSAAPPRGVQWAHLAEDQDFKVHRRGNVTKDTVADPYQSYRSGVLRFPGVAIPEKNLGLMDQQLAVE